MFEKSTYYSYTAQKNKRQRLIKFLVFFFILLIVYNCITSFFFSVWVVENNTMQPGLNAGDRLLFSSMSKWNKNEENQFNFNRSSIVLVDMRQEIEQNFFLRIIDGICRFFTAQRVSIFSGRGQFYIKRVIALGGDEISMNNNVFRVKTANSSFTLTEYELAGKPYHTVIPQGNDLWDSSIPFSGTMETILLGPDEIFVVSDDRSNTNDSRTWGPIPPSMIRARAVLRFWPLSKIELF